MALGMALFGLLVTGLLVSGVFFAATQEQRMAESSRQVEHALAAAEAGAIERLRTWNRSLFGTLPNYPEAWVDVSPTATAERTGNYRGRVLRLNEDVYLLDITGSDRAGGSIAGAGDEQRVGLIVRTRAHPLSINAAVTTQGDVRLAGAVVIDGSDRPSPAWSDCDQPDTARAGIRTAGSVVADPMVRVVGDPPVGALAAPGSGPSPWASTYDELAALAGIVLAPGTYVTQPKVSAGTCDPSNQLNWGDPAHPKSYCGNYFPIIRILDGGGTTTLTGGRGQGILLVDGTLDIHGSYEFAGIVLVRGSLHARGAGPSGIWLWGALLAREIELEGSPFGTLVGVNYSKCAIMNALRMSGDPAPLRSRGWMQLF